MKIDELSVRPGKNPGTMGRHLQGGIVSRTREVVIDEMEIEIVIDIVTAIEIGVEITTVTESATKTEKGKGTGVELIVIAKMTKNESIRRKAVHLPQVQLLQPENVHYQHDLNLRDIVRLTKKT
jgi:hypothetical protein